MSGLRQGLYAWLGVDPHQLRALLRTALRLDLRAGQAQVDRTGSAPRRSNSGVGRLLRLLLAYGLSGVWVAFWISAVDSLFATVFLHLGALMLIAGATVVLEFSSIVLATEDALALAHYPISSQTLFLSRVAHALIYTQGLGLAFSVAPLIVLLQRAGVTWGIGLGFVISASLAVTLVTIVGIACYGLVLRYVSRQHVRAMLTWAQLVLSAGIYSALLIVRRRPSGDLLDGISLDVRPELMLLPPAWFAAWGDLIERGASELNLLGLLIGLLAPLGAFLFLARVLGPGYIARLDLLLEERTEGGSKRIWSLPGFRSGEARATALLVVRQFRHDYRFRLGILGVLPLTLLYLVVAFEEGPVPDPFLQPMPTQGTVLLYLAILVSPALFVPSLVYSDAFAAAWVFHVTPADPRRLIRSMQRFLITFFMLPYLLFVMTVFLFSYGAVWHAVAHAALLGLTAGLFLLLGMLLNPGLPFATPVQRGQFNLRTFTPFVLAPLVALGVLPVVLRVGTSSIPSLVAMLGVLLVLNYFGGRGVARRIARRDGALIQLG